MYLLPTKEDGVSKEMNSNLGDERGAENVIIHVVVQG